MFQSIRNLFSNNSRQAPIVNQNSNVATMFSPFSLSQNKVTTDNAMNHTTFFTCVRIISESIMVLPISLYQEKGGKRIKITNDLSAILNKPNSFMNSNNIKSLIGVDLCLYGNSYHQVVRNGLGQVTGIYPLNATQMEVKMLDNGEVVYVYNAGTKGRIALNSEEVLHFKIFSLNGITGISPVTYNSLTLSLGMSQTEFADKQYLNNMNSNVLLSHPSILSDEAYQRLRDSFVKNYTGMANSGKPVLIEDGLKIEKLSMNNTDAEFMDNRRFTKDEIASIFRIPPHLVNQLSSATFSNIENQSLSFIKNTLMPYLICIEEEIDTKLTKKSQYVKFNVNALLRGDLESRYRAYQIGISAGFLSPNECRSLEELDAVDGLDVYAQQMNTVQISKDGKEVKPIQPVSTNE